MKTIFAAHEEKHLVLNLFFIIHNNNMFRSNAANSQNSFA